MKGIEEKFIYIKFYNPQNYFLKKYLKNKI